MLKKRTIHYPNDRIKSLEDAELPATPELLQDYDGFKALLLHHTGLDLNRYKFDQTYRRVWVMVKRAGLNRFTDYFHTVLQDKANLHELIDNLTIGVSELFRNPDRFEALRLRVLPELLRHNKTLSLWSAGCSYGAEAYSLAILLHELAPDRQHTILCTDIDSSALERAQQGIFEEANMNQVPEVYRSAYFRTCYHGSKAFYEAAPFLQQYLLFRQHNLLADHYDSGFDLIACRNVIIYFLDEAKEQVLRRFQAALKPGGCLFTGNSERIIHYRELGLDYMEPCLYRKLLQTAVDSLPACR